MMCPTCRGRPDLDGCFPCQVVCVEERDRLTRELAEVNGMAGIARDALVLLASQRDAALAEAKAAREKGESAQNAVDVLLKHNGGLLENLATAIAERDEARERASRTPVTVGGFGVMAKGLQQIAEEIDEKTRAILRAADREQTDAAAARVVAERDHARKVVESALDARFPSNTHDVIWKALKRWGVR